MEQDYHQKYIKYKTKYLNAQTGGVVNYKISKVDGYEALWYAGFIGEIKSELRNVHDSIVQSKGEPYSDYMKRVNKAIYDYIDHNWRKIKVTPYNPKWNPAPEDDHKNYIKSRIYEIKQASKFKWSIETYSRFINVLVYEHNKLLVEAKLANGAIKLPSVYKFNYGLFYSSVGKKLFRDDTSTLTHTPIEIHKMTTTEAVKKLLCSDKTGITLGVLNMANNDHIGGGYVTGANAQEEDLCRSFPILYHAVDQYKHLYPINPDTISSCIICGPVDSITRKGSSENYEVITKTDTDWILSENNDMNFISIAAPDLSNTNKIPDDMVYMQRLITIIIFGALVSGCDCLLLGAIGLGVFAPKLANKAEQDEYKRDVLRTMIGFSKEFSSLFTYGIHFACTPGDNYNKLVEIRDELYSE